ncbi:hypothetical protein AHF37_05749 [Paragonimus kellicotti]|nr:hypothetical protein AHF37_05749 [Paragonimus kellicotti]
MASRRRSVVALMFLLFCSIMFLNSWLKPNFSSALVFRWNQTKRCLSFIGTGTLSAESTSRSVQIRRNRPNQS